MKYDIRDLTKAVQAIHADLIEHDKRGDKMMEAIQRVYQLKKLEERVEAIRSFIREQQHVEI